MWQLGFHRSSVLPIENFKTQQECIKFAENLSIQFKNGVKDNNEQIFYVCNKKDK